MYVPMLEKQKNDKQIQISYKFPGRVVVFLPFSRDDVFSDFKFPSIKLDHTLSHSKDVGEAQETSL